VFVKHPAIKPRSIEDRAYQSSITKSCLERSTLVVLPTGLGKTVVALRVIADIIHGDVCAKVLFMAPTKPLVEQHANFLREHLLGDPVIEVFTGEVSPAKRAKLWADTQIVCSTPQVISNDLISRRISLKDVKLVIYDEAHRAVGDYAYVFVAEKHHGQGLSLGMTASPGSDYQKILEVCRNLGIEGVEIRSQWDADVVNYVQDVKVRWIRVDVPAAYGRIIEHLRKALDGYVKVLRKHGFLIGQKYVSTKALLGVGVEIRRKLNEPDRPSSLFTAASTQAEAVKVNHALELVETQGVTALNAYFERLLAEADSRGSSKASKSVIKNPDVIKAIELARGTDIEHPKLARAAQIVGSQLQVKKNSRVIVFTHYRDTSEKVVRELEKVKGAKPCRFVGQASKVGDKGLRQKDQVAMIRDFKAGKYNVLVATSVAEEGLDIPSTDLVVFYEPIPSEIRTIQRRGRTGRKRTGHVAILITRNTRDEAYYWASRNREKEMHKQLNKLRGQLGNVVWVGEPGHVDGPLDVMGDEETATVSESRPSVPCPADVSTTPVNNESSPPAPPSRAASTEAAHASKDHAPVTISAAPAPVVTSLSPLTPKKGQASLMDFEPAEPDTLTIITDHREFKSQVVRELAKRDVVVKPSQLDVGDYIISDRMGVERKEVKDFLSSLMDGRLFQQARRLKAAYVRPVMILEGEGLLVQRNLNPSSIYGALASIVGDFSIPVFQTKDARETARVLEAMAKREQGGGRQVSVRPGKSSLGEHEMAQFIVEGLPNVSAVMAQRLLSHFKTVQAIVNASEKELGEVKGVGKKTAEAIYEVLRQEWI